MSFTHSFININSKYTHVKNIKAHNLHWKVCNMKKYIILLKIWTKNIEYFSRAANRGTAAQQRLLWNNKQNVFELGSKKKKQNTICTFSPVVELTSDFMQQFEIIKNDVYRQYKNWVKHMLLVPHQQGTVKWHRPIRLARCEF